MKKVVCLVMIAVGLLAVGCNKKEDATGAPVAQQETQSTVPVSESDKEVTLKFLRAVQAGDKKLMYEAVNLTAEQAAQAKDKLIHAGQNKMNDQERAELQNALRISGQIDFFTARIVKLFPKSALFEIVDSKPGAAVPGGRSFVHTVKVSYPVQQEAFFDKTGKPMKEMTIPLQQISRPVQGKEVHEIAFAGNDYEKIGLKEFNVISYH